MELKTNADSLVEKMNNIQFTWNEMLKENSELQDKMSIDEKELMQCKNAINRGEKELKKMQSLLEQLQQHVSEIPVMKQRQVELEDKQNNADKLLVDKDIKISNMKAEHDKAMKDASNDFEKIKDEITSLEAQKLVEIQNMLSLQHKEQLEILEKERDGEINQLQTILLELEQKLLEKEQQHDQRSLIYEAELNKIKNQLNLLRDATSQNKPGSAEIFRKKMQSMQQHYESQLKELEEKLQMTLQDESIKTPIIKKNVGFNLSVGLSTVNNKEPVPISTKLARRSSSSVSLPVHVGSISVNDKNEETGDRQLTDGDDFRSLFLDAAINFGSENYSSSKDYKKSDKSSTNNSPKPIFKFAKKTTTLPQHLGYSEFYQNKVITSEVTKSGFLTNSHEAEVYQTPSSILGKDVKTFVQNNPNSDQVSSSRFQPFHELESLQHKRFILASRSKTKMTSPMSVSNLIQQKNLSYTNNQNGVYESYNRKRKSHS